MKRFQAEQTQKTFKSKDSCVEISTYVVLGGGGNLELAPQGFRAFLKNIALNKVSRIGFTLAEVLITLGIIGVVAAMTMPSLIANHREKETVVRLKKAYSTLSNAYIGVLNEYGDPSTWDVESWDDVALMFSKYMKNVKICKLGAKGCFASVVRKDLLNNTVDNIGGSAAIVINDGTIVGFDSQVEIEEALNGDFFQFEVDINGDKLPNRWGVDTFTFNVTKDKVTPRGGADTHARQLMCNPSSDTTTAGWWNGSGCGAWVIQMENMDYLKCVNGNQKYCNKEYYFN